MVDVPTDLLETTLATDPGAGTPKFSTSWYDIDMSINVGCSPNCRMPIIELAGKLGKFSVVFNVPVPGLRWEPDVNSSRNFAWSVRTLALVLLHLKLLVSGQSSCYATQKKLRINFLATGNEMENRCTLYCHG